MTSLAFNSAEPALDATWQVKRWVESVDI